MYGVFTIPGLPCFSQRISTFKSQMPPRSQGRMNSIKCRNPLKIVTLTLLALISAISIIISSSSLCRSTSRERCRHLQILQCKCRVWPPLIQGRTSHNKTDHLLSCHNNLPWGNLLWLLFGGVIDCSINRFLFLLTFIAIFTDSVNTNFHFIDSAGVSLPQRFGVNN